MRINSTLEIGRSSEEHIGNRHREERLITQLGLYELGMACMSPQERAAAQQLIISQGSIGSAATSSEVQV